MGRDEVFVARGTGDVGYPGISEAGEAGSGICAGYELVGYITPVYLWIE